MRTTWTFHGSGQLVFGRNAVQQTGAIVERLKARRALIVADKTMVDAGLVDKVVEPVLQAGLSVQIFDGGRPEPPIETALECIAQAQAYRPDVLIGLGGGSNMDLAKITAVVVKHGGHPLDYAGDDRVPGPTTPVVCIPTTAGTGSEVSAASVLTDAAKGMKFGVLSNYLRPHAAVVDPLLTVSCPPKVTADSGIDALTHAVEAYTAVDNEFFPLPAGERSVYQGRHPYGDMLAEKAIELVGRWLRAAVEDGSNLEARDGMALAAVFAGLAFSNVGVAAVHALEYPIGAAVHCSHGAGNGLLLPYVMRFNLPSRLPQFSRIAALLGEDVSGLTLQASAELSITSVERLRDSIGVPSRLRDLGAQPTDLPGWASKSFAVQRILRVNPRPVTESDLLSILESAY